MNLQEFTSPLPKPWLNIVANSVHVGPGGGPSGAPVSVTAYSKSGLTTISNTNVQTSLSGNAVARGSLALGPLPVGSVVRMRALGELNYAIAPGGGISTFLTVNGSNVFTFPWPMPQANINLTPTEIEVVFTVLGGGLAAGSMRVLANGYATYLQNAPATEINPSGPPPPRPAIAFNNTISNTVDLAILFGNASASNQWINAYTYTVEVLAAN